MPVKRRHRVIERAGPAAAAYPVDQDPRRDLACPHSAAARRVWVMANGSCTYGMTAKSAQASTCAMTSVAEGDVDQGREHLVPQAASRSARSSTTAARRSATSAD